MLDMKNTISKKRRIIFYIVMLTILAVFLIAECVNPSERTERSMEASICYTGTFVWEKPDGTEEIISVPGKYEVPVGETMVITTQLPADYNESCSAIFTAGCKVLYRWTA